MPGMARAPRRRSPSRKALVASELPVELRAADISASDADRPPSARGGMILDCAFAFPFQSSSNSRPRYSGAVRSLKGEWESGGPIHAMAGNFLEERLKSYVRAGASCCSSHLRAKD